MDAAAAADEGSALLTDAPLGYSPSYRALERKAGVTLVLVANALERVTFFSVTTCMVYFLSATSPHCYNDHRAATAGYLFGGVTYGLCALGGVLADCVLSKFAAAAAGYAIYLAAFVTLVVKGYAVAVSDSGPAVYENDTLSAAECFGFTGYSNYSRNVTSPWCPHSASDSEVSACVASFAVTMAGVAVGAALVQTNLAAFGADQVRQHGMKVTRGFFSWLYWTRNVGAVVALTGISQLQTGEHGLFASSLASFCCLLLSAVIFCGGFKLYVRQPPNRQAIKNFLAILPEALAVKRQSKGSRSPHLTPQSLLDNAKVYYGGSYHDKAVEEVKVGRRMLVVYVLLIPYWIGFSQIVNTFQVQGLHMKAPAKETTVILPPTLLLFDSVSVLVTLPLLNNYVYPYIGRRGHRLTLHSRISMGMLFASLSFVVAGCVESFRLHSLDCALCIVNQTIGHTIYFAAPMSVMFQIPQYVLLGISEAFTYVTAMEYAYLVAPKAMRSIMIGVLLAFAGAGQFISVSLQSIYTGPSLQWWNMNRSHYDYVFYGLAGMQLLAAVVFFATGKQCDVGLNRLTIMVRRPLPPQLLDQQPSTQNAGLRPSDAD